jgi:hypothetical protein
MTVIVLSGRRVARRDVEYDLEVSLHTQEGPELVSVFQQVFTMLEFRKSNPSQVEQTSSQKKKNV